MINTAGTIMRVGMSEDMKEGIKYLAYRDGVSMSLLTREAIEYYGHLVQEDVGSRDFCADMHFYVDEFMYNRIARRSEELNLSMSEFVRRCVTLYLESECKHHDGL